DPITTESIPDVTTAPLPATKFLVSSIGKNTTTGISASCVTLGHQSSCPGLGGTGVGWSSSAGGSNSVAVGISASTTQARSTALGGSASATANGALAIGFSASCKFYINWNQSYK